MLFRSQPSYVTITMRSSVVTPWFEVYRGEVGHGADKGGRLVFDPLLDGYSGPNEASAEGCLDRGTYTILARGDRFRETGAFELTMDLHPSVVDCALEPPDTTSIRTTRSTTSVRTTRTTTSVAPARDSLTAVGTIEE